MPLNDKQARFAAEYLVDLNATQAAIRAGYSEKTAHAQGHDLLKHPEVAERIGVLMAERSARTQISADRVLEELAAMAFYDPADIAAPMLAGERVAVTGPADIPNLPEAVRRAIVGWGWDRKGNFTLKLSPKTPSLQLIMQHLGMLKTEIDLNFKGQVASELEKARRRASEQHGERDPQRPH